MKLQLSPLRFVVVAGAASLGLFITAWLIYVLLARDFFRHSKCPRCGGVRNRTSAFPSALDRLLRLVSFKPLRCLTCGHRYYRAGWAREAALEESEPMVWTADYGGDSPPKARTKADSA